MVEIFCLKNEAIIFIFSKFAPLNTSLKKKKTPVPSESGVFSFVSL